jgi:hypothetical protein
VALSLRGAPKKEHAKESNQKPGVSQAFYLGSIDIGLISLAVVFPLAGTINGSLKIAHPAPGSQGQDGHCDAFMPCDQYDLTFIELP